jgi:glucose-1-phosphate adenylyltransferase
MIMAGGKGERLMPLTAVRSKPSVPFAGKYRIVDFVLSNFLNSEILAMYVLVQYRSQSLIEHLRRGWRIGGRIKQNFITVVPPQMKARGGWYEGTADAVYQNLNLIHDFRPDVVAVFGADHIYRMDIGQMVQFHLDRNADVTVAARPVRLNEAKGFGIIDVKTGDPDERIRGFQEKPKRPVAMPKDPERAYSSMGNYVFKADVLMDVLERDAARLGSHDFGRDIIPPMLRTHRVLAYNFLHNEVPGIRPYEEQGYWRDVGTLDAYWQAHMDLLGQAPVFDLRNNRWPILTDDFDGPAVSIVRSQLDEVMIGQGSRVIDADIRRSVIGRNVVIDQGACIEECIILDGSVIGAKARLRRVIADRFNVLPPGAEIGYGGPRLTTPGHGTRSGITVLPRGRDTGQGAGHAR